MVATTTFAGRAEVPEVKIPEVLDNRRTDEQVSTTRETPCSKASKFILRGNVVELATAVIIGGAFTAIVTAFTSSIIEPLFAAIPTGSCDSAPAATEAAEGTIAGPIQSCPLGFKILSDNEATFMDFGALLTAIINFLIIAAVVYFLIVMPYQALRAA